MTPLIFFLIVLYIAAAVAAQVWLKRAMGSHRESSDPLPSAIRKAFFVVAIVAMALSVFLKLGLLQDYDLSYLFPFEALQVIIIALSARIFLREKLTKRLIFGLILISVGISLVAAT